MALPVCGAAGVESSDVRNLAAILRDMRADVKALKMKVGYPGKFLEVPESVKARRLQKYVTREVELRRDGELFDVGEESVGYVEAESETRPLLFLGESKAEAFNEKAEDFEQTNEMVETQKGHWRTPLPLALRYFRFKGDAPKAVRFVEEIADVVDRVPFAGTEREVRMRKVALRTLRLCMRDFLIDGVKRDRLPWSGDLSVSLLANAYSYREPEIVKRTLTVLDSAGWEAGDVNGIIDFSFWLVISHEKFQEHFGDLDFLKASYPKIAGRLESFTGRVGADGLIDRASIERHPTWLFIDWTKDAKSTTAVNMLHYGALLAGAKLANRVGAKEDAVRWTARAAAIKAKLHEKAWDAERGLFRFDVTDPAFGHFTRHANLYAAYFGVAEGAELVSIGAALAADDLPAVGTPYASAYQVMALLKCGRADAARNYLERVWGGMLDAGATSFWEGYDEKEKGDERWYFYRRPFGKSLCHAWSAAPVFLLPMLQAQPNANVDWYAVDPMAETPYMPDSAPKGGVKGGTVRIVAAKGEYEPGSFVLVAGEDLGKVQLEVGDLKREEGRGKREEVVFPKDKIDLRNVKVWYQAGTAWFSYFQDVKQKLCPELLLHDEDLVFVDEKKGWNYARTTEKDGTVNYRWLNPPRAVDSRLEDASGGYSRFVGDSFSGMKPNFSDADTFQGVTLQKGVHKQILLTVKVEKGQKAGLYRGEVKVKGEGEQWKIPLSLRVLDFELPEPCTYLDCNRRFYTRFCQYVSLNHIMGANGNDRELAEKQMVAILRNFAEHGCRLPSYLDRREHPEWGREAGLDFAHPLYEAGDMRLGEKVAMRYHARREKEKITKLFGWHRPYMCWGDEFGLKTLVAIRDMVRIYQEVGFRYLTNSQSGWDAGIQMMDTWRPPYTPDGANFNLAFKVSRLGDEELGWYANQHVGPENPAFNRRQYGFGPYRAGYTFDGNYAQHLQGWNDIAYDPYRPMMFIYGSGNGCLDTIQWEGFREGVDDIRYATKLQRLALPLVKSEDPRARTAAKLALKLLADADGDDMDLTTLRLEMIRHIKRLMAHDVTSDKR